LRRETGALAILFNRLLAAFDDEYERRRAAGESLRFEEVLSAPPVGGHVHKLRDFLAPTGTGWEIKDFLDARVSDQYKRYVALTTRVEAKDHFEDTLEAALLDSAGFAICLAHVVALFNRHAVDADVLAEFGSIGMLAKLADDVVDFWRDLDAREPNLLHGLVRRDPQEYAKVRAVMPHPPRTDAHWWETHCPKAFEDLAALISEHRARLGAPSLRLAGDLLLIAPARGRSHYHESSQLPGTFRA
jgi:hypothetical protein